MKSPRIYFKKFYYWLSWSKRRRYNYAKRFNYVLKNLLILAISIIAIIFVYNSFETLSFIGWAILLGTLYFGVKHSFRLIKELKNWYSRQINIIKIIVILGIIILLFYGYQNRNIISDKFNEIDFKSKINFNDSLFSGVGDIEESELSSFEQIIHEAPKRKEECMQTFVKLNEIRSSYGKNTIDWDDRAYELAVVRSKDMQENDYMDHTSPTGQCPENMKEGYGFKGNEYLAENAGGMSYYSKGNVAGDCDEALEGWLSSRGHRYNLLSDDHFAGAIGCYYELCVFLGVHNDFYGLGGGGKCYTAAEGQAFWEDAPIQSGEI